MNNQSVFLDELLSILPCFEMMFHVKKKLSRTNV